MGRKDSSATRVGPVFWALYASDPTGGSWLKRLLELPDRFDGTRPPPVEPGALVAHAWHPAERRLPAPKALLRLLIERLAATGAAPGGVRLTAERERLLAGDADALETALRLLDDPETTERWHLFEGPTSVDALLETETHLILIEGKRTESRPTTKTAWMPVRHQILRNIDAGMDGSKEVIGFFIVEGREPSPVEVPEEWRKFVRATVDDGALRESLPHRTGEDRAAIGEAFRGATTWQRVCSEFRIPWTSLPHLLEEPQRWD